MSPFKAPTSVLPKTLAFLYVAGFVSIGACGRAGQLQDMQATTQESSANLFARLPPILMYHEITTGPAKGGDVGIAAFQAQMDWLKSQGANTLSMEELEAGISGNRPFLPKSVVITFDDGYQGQYSNARPILKNRNLKATFFIHTDYVGVEAPVYGHMSWSEVNALEAHPLFEVQSHTRTHASLPSLDSENQVKEILGSRTIFNSKLGKAPTALSFPYGDYNAKVLQNLINAHYRLGFAVDQRGTFELPAKFSLPRIGIGHEVNTLEKFKARVRLKLN